MEKPYSTGSTQESRPAAQRACSGRRSNRAEPEGDAVRTSIGVVPSEAQELPASDSRLLLREFNYRVNNDFSSAISVISSAAARSPSDEVRLALSMVQDRLQSYASVHRALQVPEHSTRIDAAAYLLHLCRALSRSQLEARGIKLVLAADTLHMNSEACWRLGVIMFELVTNAARHAFGEGGGEIRVELRQSRSFVEFRIADNGAADALTCPTNVREIVDALVKTLNGRIEQRSAGTGAMWVVIFPHGR
jgi:two-component sensor histidine kinase